MLMNALSPRSARDDIARQRFPEGLLHSAEYHRRQATTLNSLATIDSLIRQTAAALMRLAGEHTAMAEETAPEPNKRNADPNHQSRR